MRNTTDNGPKNGDFVRYIEQLEKVQFQNTARLMQQAQARSPGQVRPIAAAKPVVKNAVKQTALQPLFGKLTALSTAQADNKAGQQSKTATERYVLYGLGVLGAVLGVTVITQLLELPAWVAVIIMVFIASNYFKKSKQQKNG
jgi:hypothetical protein